MKLPSFGNFLNKPDAPSSHLSPILISEDNSQTIMARKATKGKITVGKEDQKQSEDEEGPRTIRDV